MYAGIRARAAMADTSRHWLARPARRLALIGGARGLVMTGLGVRIAGHGPRAVGAQAPGHGPGGVPVSLCEHGFFPSWAGGPPAGPLRHNISCKPAAR